MKTDLYDHHVSLGAKMVNFSGWLMPVQYKGIIPEHKAVREAVGIFDVSHMGRVLVEGAEAEAFLEWLSTNQISGKKNGTATYTAWCREDGGTVDDLIIYKRDQNHFFVVVNAGNRAKDLQHMTNEGGRFDIRITDRYKEDGILAIQGPGAEAMVAKLFADVSKIKPFHFQPVAYEGEEIILAATGYTGAGGFEICGSKRTIRLLWEYFIKQGAEPIGLGARDTLRLEMGYALYGHELTEEIAPNETVSSWTVRMSKHQFLGKNALHRYTRHQYGVILTDKGIAREGYPVFQGDQQIGTVTSGTMSPTLGKAIAIILVDRELHPGDTVQVQIRSQKAAAEVVKLPFLQKQESKHEIHRKP